MMDQDLENCGLSKNDDIVVIKAHMRVTNASKKSNKCNQCGYASSELASLRKHLMIHSGEKRNKCNHCDFASFYPSALMTHVKRHSGEKSNRCSQCDYASSQAGNLRKHLKTHSGQKSHKCNQCGYASYQAGHFIKHSGEKTNKSKQMNSIWLFDMTFFETDSLKMHFHSFFLTNHLLGRLFISFKQMENVFDIWKWMIFMASSWLRGSMGFDQYKKWTKVDTCCSFNQISRTTTNFRDFFRKQKLLT